MPFIKPCKTQSRTGARDEYLLVGEEQWIRKDPARFEVWKEIEREEGERRRKKKLNNGYR